MYGLGLDFMALEAGHKPRSASSDGGGGVDPRNMRAENSSAPASTTIAPAHVPQTQSQNLQTGLAA